MCAQSRPGASSSPDRLPMMCWRAREAVGSGRAVPMTKDASRSADEGWRRTAPHLSNGHEHSANRRGVRYQHPPRVVHLDDTALRDADLAVRAIGRCPGYSPHVPMPASAGDPCDALFAATAPQPPGGAPSWRSWCGDVLVSGLPRLADCPCASSWSRRAEICRPRAHARSTQRHLVDEVFYGPRRASHSSISRQRQMPHIAVFGHLRFVALSRRLRVARPCRRRSEASILSAT